jgi:hypothetical protein
MKNNYQSIIKKNLSTENSINESKKKIKNNLTQITFIDQNLRAIGGYKFEVILNKRQVCINFPTVLYNYVLESDFMIDHIKRGSDHYKFNLPLILIKENIAESAFLIIRIKNIEQLLLTTTILYEYAKAGDFQLPLTIIVCSKDQLADVQNTINEIPIPVICTTILNFTPKYGNDTDLGTEDIEKLLTQNIDIQKIFEENQFQTNNPLTTSHLSFFSKPLCITGAILFATSVGYLTLNRK